MDAIDRLGWAAGVAFQAHGCDVGVRVTDEAILPYLMELLPHGWTPSSTQDVERLYSIVVGGSEQSSPVRRFNLLYCDWTRIERSLDMKPIYETFDSSLRVYLERMGKEGA